MPPRRRPRSGTSRMDAAIHAMKQFGFDDKVVTAKMRELLKVYDGQYEFIENDAYNVLLEGLLADQNKENCHEENQEESADRETSNANVIVEPEKAEEGQPIVPTAGFIGIPVCSFSPIPPPPLPHTLEASLLLLPPAPVLDGTLPLPPVHDAALPPPPPPPFLEAPPPLLPPAPVLDATLPLPPPRPPVHDAALPLPPPLPTLDAGRPLPPPTPATYAGPPLPGFARQYRRRKPCHGWINDDDEEEMHCIRLPRSRWDVRPEDM